MRRPVFIALVLSIAVWGAACDAQPSTAPTTTPPTTARASNGPDAIFAMWPEDNAADAAESDRSGERGQDVALRFAEEVLGWSDASAEFYTGPVRCPSQVCVSVTRDAGGPSIVVALVGVTGDNDSVGFVTSDDHVDVSLSLDVRGAEVDVIFDPASYPSIDFEIGYGDCVARRTYSGPVDDTFDLSCTPKTTGHYLILFRDGSGAVVGALGSALPEGDLAAG